MAILNIEGLDKAAVLAALYNSSKAQGMGHRHFDPTPMTVEQAQAVIDGRGDDVSAMFAQKSGPHLSFDYLKGRVMKIDISGDTLDTWGYDRDVGQGAAEQALSALLTVKA